MNNLTYSDFKQYTTTKVYRNIRMVTWHDTCDESSGILSELYMPFNAYIISRDDVSDWLKWRNLHEQEVSNAVYILYGPSFIYVGKSINADRIKDHQNDHEKDGFMYQLVFVPNKEHKISFQYWDALFMEYLETNLINLVKETSDFCKNKIDGINQIKAHRNFGHHDAKIKFCENVALLILDAFMDISYHKHLFGQTEKIHDEDIEENNETDLISNIQQLMQDDVHMCAFKHTGVCIGYQADPGVSKRLFHYEFKISKKEDCVYVCLHYEPKVSGRHTDQLTDEIFKLSGLEVNTDWAAKRGKEIIYAAPLDPVEAVKEMKKFMNMMDPIILATIEKYGAKQE